MSSLLHCAPHTLSYLQRNFAKSMEESNAGWRVQNTVKVKQKTNQFCKKLPPTLRRCSISSSLSYVTPLGVITGSLKISVLIRQQRYSGTCRIPTTNQERQLQSTQKLAIGVANITYKSYACKEQFKEIRCLPPQPYLEHWPYEKLHLGPPDAPDMFH